MGDQAFIYRNPLDLPRISYADMLHGSADGVYVAPPGEPRIFRRAPPTFHDDPDRVGLFPPFREVEVTYPPVFTVSWRDVTLAGFRSLLTHEKFFFGDTGHLTPEEALAFARGLTKSNEMGRLTPCGPDGTFSLDAGGSEIRLSGTVVILSSAEPGNFGSFLYRDLAKLVNLPEIPKDWRFLAHLPLASFQQFLELAGIPMERVIQHDLTAVYRIERAIVPGLRNPYAFADHETRALYGRIRNRAFDESDVPENRGRRIYVSRGALKASLGRVMVNESDVVARLLSLDFEIVEPQYLSAAAQIITFASADLVVGPSGSGMFNAVFCTPGAKLIDIESEPHWIYPHTSLFASAGLNYGIFEGKAVDQDWTVHHKPWAVDVDALVKRIESFAPRDASGPSVRNTPPAFWSIADHGGDDYMLVLERFHKTLKPRTYLEIGVSTGASLALASCPSIAIDPKISVERLTLGNKPACLLFQTTGDRFFSEYNPRVLLSAPIDMAFLDGMHWYEYLLRDFINVEPHCKRNSILILHDCLPTDAHVGRREVEDHKLRRRSQHPDWWAGDVWKVLAILKKYRTDLQLSVFDAPPTGLVAVTNLDPSSVTLSEHYFDLVKEFADQTLDEHGAALFASLDVVDTRQLLSPTFLSHRLWL